MPDRFVVADDGVGPTCAFYLGMGNMPWSRPGGDWVDAAGERYGGKPFDATPVPFGRGRQLVELDVTELIRAWLDGRYRNAGMLLRAQTGAGPVAFHSRESIDASARPTLKLEWADGTRSRLAPSADTYLDCSTYSSLGAQRHVSVGADYSALFAFNLPRVPGARLVRGSLLLVSDRQYGTGATVGVYRADPPYVRPQGRIELGIAKEYRADQGIQLDPAVLMADDFESVLWFIDWLGIGWLRSNAVAVREDPERGFEPVAGRALRVTLKRGGNLGLDLSYVFRNEKHAEPEEIYFRYYLRFADDWNPSADGGKLPGIAGTYGRAGWGMRKTDGYNGWSMRGKFALRPKATPSVAAMTAIGSYAYHADVADSAGDTWAWSEGPAAVLENNRWYCLEQYVKLNTPGQKDGIFRAWVDGQRVIDKTDVRYRNVAQLKIESVWLNVYHGGEVPSPSEMSLYIDSVVVARQYIGPMKR